MSTNPPLANLTQSPPFPFHSYDHRIKKGESQVKEMFLGISVYGSTLTPSGRAHLLFTTSCPLQHITRSFSCFAFFSNLYIYITSATGL